MDHVQRIHGYAKVTGREIYVTVGIAQVEAMAAANTNGSGAWWVAFTASVVVTATGGMILWEIFNLRANRRRQRNYTRSQSNLESMQTEVATIRARSAIASARMATLLRISGDGLALVNAELQLVAWNQRFAAECGVPPELLQEGMPVDELFRQQARAGLFASVQSDNEEAIETEIAQRVAILRTEPAGAVLPQRGPDGHSMALYIDVVPGGGGMVLVTNASEV